MRKPKWDLEVFIDKVFRNLLGLIALLSLIPLSISLINWGISSISFGRPETPAIPDSQLSTQVAILGSELREVKLSIDSMTTLEPDVIIAANVYAVGTQVALVDSRLGAMEQAVLESPDRALAIPVLRRDLDRLAEEQDETVRRMEASVNQLVDLGKWFFGFIVASMASLVFSNFVSNRKSSRESKDA